MHLAAHDICMCERHVLCALQTVKARVVSVDEERQRLRLSFAPKTAADAAVAAGADSMGGLQPGAIVEGRVRSVTTKEVGQPHLFSNCHFY